MGFRVFLFVDVFLFFSLRPSHMSETFTYGSVQVKEDNKKEGHFHRTPAGHVVFLYLPDAPVMSMALRLRAFIMVIVNLPAVGR